MLRKMPMLIFMVTSLFISTNLFAKELPNLGLLRQQLIAYHDSGAYAKDFAIDAQKAINYLQQRIVQNKKSAHPAKLAIVIDIDETALSNYDDMVKINFGGTDDEVNAAENAGHDPANLPILKLYNLASKNNVSVFFITGRRENGRSGTVRNLQAVGYTNYKALIMKSNAYHLASAIPYKSAMRKKIVAKGYDVVLSIGDQFSDLKGGYADRTFKVVNPYYYIA